MLIEKILHMASDLKPKPDWPKAGQINMLHLSLTYGDDIQVLKDITLRINPKEKVSFYAKPGDGVAICNEPDGWSLRRILSLSDL